MRNTINIMCATFLFAVIAANGGTTFDREVIAQCVVQLVDERVATEQVNGETAEVWFHFPDGHKIPKKQYCRGSAFLVNDGNCPLLVTASHLAKSMTPSSLAILMGPKGEPVRLSLGQLTGKSASANWLHHDKADVAVLQLSPSPGMRKKHLLNRFLPLDVIAGERKAPSRSIPLVVFGFPLGLGSSGKQFSPLTRQTHCASNIIMLRRADAPVEAECFLLEDPSVAGYSGGPVFDIGIYQLGGIQTTGSGTTLWGLVHGTSSDQTGGKLAVVVPGYSILEVIEKGRRRQSLLPSP